MRPDCDFDFPVAEGTPALIGVAVFIDIDAAVHIATLKKDTDKFFISLWIHASTVILTAISR